MTTKTLPQKLDTVIVIKYTSFIIKPAVINISGDLLMEIS